jgi:GT2 family glycosyltransferase
MMSVVVASRGRPLRLRWLLNALEDQRAEGVDWEVVIAADAASVELLATHPLVRSGRVRFVAGDAHGTRAGRLDDAWRAARGDTLAFVHDDCRPPENWLAAVAGTAERHPDAVLEGSTRPDPWEASLLPLAPYAATHSIDPPTAWLVGCNVAYPRMLVEQCGGFDRSLREGGHADLAARARCAGAPHVAAPEIAMNHAVRGRWLGRRLADTLRMRDLPRVARRNPELRDALVARVFWNEGHARVAAAAAGLALARRVPALAILALPWAAAALPRYGSSTRARAKSVSELPARAAIDCAELAALAAGSIRHRTVVL